MVSAILAIASVDVLVKAQMATLAQRMEVIFLYIVFIRVWPVGHRQHHLTACHRMRLAMLGTATTPGMVMPMVMSTLALAFASPTRALKADAQRDGVSVARVFAVIDGHTYGIKGITHIAAKMYAKHKCLFFIGLIP